MKKTNSYKSVADRIIKSYEDDLYYKNHFITNVLSKHIVDKKTLESLQVVTLPFVRFVTDAISTLYNQPTIRSLNTENTKILDLFKEVENAYINIATNVDKYTFISGMCALKAHYDDIDDNFEYILFPNNMLEYTPRADDYSKYEELGFDFMYESNKIEECWSRSEYSKNIDGVKFKSKTNPYGFIPFTLFKNKIIPNNFYVSPNQNLLDIQDYLSNQMTQVGNSFKYQSMNMLVIRGGVDVKQINYGANAVNRIATDDNMDFIGPNTDLNSLVSTINEQIKTFSRINGIPDSLISAAATSSGVSLTVSQKVLDEYLKNRSKLFIQNEKDALMNGLKVMAYHKGIILPKDIKINISHSAANQTNKISEQEMKLWDFYINKNILSNVDLLMTINPMMTREEAINKLEKNKEENERFNTIPYINSLNTEINNNNTKNFKDAQSIVDKENKIEKEVKDEDIN